jgi:hypothetical protein
MSIEKNVEVAEIEGALATLLAAIDQQRTKVATIDHTSQYRPVSDPSVDDLVNDPVRQSCRLGIRRLGERLQELDGGHTGLMREVLDRVCKNNAGWAEIVNCGGMA